MQLHKILTLKLEKNKAREWNGGTLVWRSVMWWTYGQEEKGTRL